MGKKKELVRFNNDAFNYASEQYTGPDRPGKTGSNPGISIRQDLAIKCVDWVIRNSKSIGPGIFEIDRKKFDVYNEGGFTLKETVGDDWGTVQKLVKTGIELGKGQQNKKQAPKAVPKKKSENEYPPGTTITEFYKKTGDDQKA